MTSTVPKDQPSVDFPFTKDELDHLLLNIDSYSPQDQEELLLLLEEKQLLPPMPSNSTGKPAF